MHCLLFLLTFFPIKFTISDRTEPASRCYNPPIRSIYTTSDWKCIAVWSRFFPLRIINLSWRKCKRGRACVAKVRNSGEALTNVAMHALLCEPFLSTSAVPAQFRIRFISLSAVAEWKEADKLLFTCKHDTEFACSFRTACCFVKFIFIYARYRSMFILYRSLL